MIHPLSEQYTYKYVLRNKSGHLIYDGSPMCSIRKENTGEYWNGVGWSDSEVLLNMSNEGDGTYSYQIAFNEVGIYTISASDETYSDSLDTFEIKVTSGEAELLNETHTIKRIITDEVGFPIEGLIPEVEIKRNSDNQYFDGVDWVISQTSLAMEESEPGTYIYDFTYSEAEEFSIRITEITTDLDYSYTLTFSETLHESYFPQEGSLFLVSSESLLGTSGTGSQILDPGGKPVASVNVEIHNKETKEVFRAVSNDMGKWSIYIPKGNYVFIFSHPDFKTVSLEREVF